MGKIRIEAASGEIRLEQARRGEEHSVTFPVEDADVVIAWIRSAKAQLQRAKLVADVSASRRGPNPLPVTE